MRATVTYYFSSKYLLVFAHREIGLSLSHRLRCWDNVKSALGQIVTLEMFHTTSPHIIRLYKYSTVACYTK